jgi:predicted ester cyclase
MDPEENKAVVQRLFDAISSGRLDELAQVVAPDVVDHNAVILMQPEGPGGVEEGVRMLRQGFPDLRLTTQELLAEGDQVVARFTMSGTNTGDYRGLPAPTQQHFESEAIAILRVAWMAGQSQDGPARMRRRVRRPIRLIAGLLST